MNRLDRDAVWAADSRAHKDHHLFAQYAEMNSKICNVPDSKANSFSSNNCSYRYGIVTIKTQLQKLKPHNSNRQL